MTGTRSLSWWRECGWALTTPSTFSGSNPVTAGASGDTPMFMRDVTACTGCHRIEREQAGQGGR